MIRHEDSPNNHDPQISKLFDHRTHCDRNTCDGSRRLLVSHIEPHVPFVYLTQRSHSAGRMLTPVANPN
jgi:hypothetical protein